MRYIRPNDGGCGILDKGVMSAPSLIEREYNNAKDGKSTTMEAILNIITAYSPVADPDEFAKKARSIYNKVIINYVEGNRREKQHISPTLRRELKTYAGLAATFMFFMELELFNWRGRQGRMANFEPTAKAFLPPAHPFSQQWAEAVDNIVDKIRTPLGRTTIQEDFRKESDAFDMLARPISADQQKLKDEFLTELATCPPDKVRSVEAKIFEDGMTFERMLDGRGTFITGGMVNTRVPLAMQFWAPNSDPNFSSGAKSDIMLLSKYFWSVPETTRLAGTSKDQIQSLQQQLKDTATQGNTGNGDNGGNTGNGGDGGNNREPEVPTPHINNEQRQVFAATTTRVSKALEAEIKVKHASHLNEKERLAVMEASAAVLQSAADQELNPLQIAQLASQQLATSATAASVDPTSPYYGMTSQQICTIVGGSVFGADFINELAQGVNAAINQLVGVYTSAQQEHSAHQEALNTLFQTMPKQRPHFIARSSAIVRIRNKAQDDLQELIEDASVIFNIDEDAIDERNSDILVTRENGWPLAIAVAVGVAIWALYSLVPHIQAQAKKACSQLLEQARAKLHAFRSSITMKNSLLAKRTQADLVRAQLVKEVERMSATPSDTFSCYQEHIRPMYEAYINLGDVTNGDVGGQIEARVAILSGGVDTTREMAKLLDEQATELAATDPVGVALAEFRKLLSETIMPVLRYAAYTALGLGVLWGSIKVYKSITNKDDS